MVPISATPSGLRPRGEALWSALVASRDLDGGSHILAEEACRIADRLDSLNRVLRGDVDTWLTFRLTDDGVTIKVVIDGVLSEARQQANILRLLIAALPVRGDDDGDENAAAFVEGLGMSA